MNGALLRRLRATGTRQLRSQPSSKRSCRIQAQSDVEAHNRHQQELFDSKVHHFTAPLPAQVPERLARIVSSVPDLADARVIDVGSGTGCLIPELQAAGARDVLSVDLSPKMLAEVERRFGPAPTLGNSPAVRTWRGDICELPVHLGGARAVFMNGVFGNIHDPKAALLKACTLLLEGGFVVLSHPLGRAWHRELHEGDAAMVPHELPGRERLGEMIADLPLEVVSFDDEEEYYCAVLHIPEGYRIRGGPLQLQGKVVTGFQRGSKQMGVPTANVAPTSVEAQFEGRPKGVYFGWAQLQGATSESDGAVHAMVLNYGVRPTIQDGSNVTVRWHELQQHDTVINTNAFVPRKAWDAQLHHDFPCAHYAQEHQFRSAIRGTDFYAAASARTHLDLLERAQLAQVEAHILHTYEDDFYGEALKLLVVGFIRPEMQFAGLDDLINRIHTDIGLAQNQLARQDPRQCAPQGWWA